LTTGTTNIRYIVLPVKIALGNIFPQTTETAAKFAANVKLIQMIEKKTFRIIIIKPFQIYYSTQFVSKEASSVSVPRLLRVMSLVPLSEMRLIKEIDVLLGEFIKHGCYFISTDCLRTQSSYNY